MPAIRFEDYFEMLDPDEIRLKGHRIWLEDVVDLYKAGKTAEELAARFPTLTLEQIQATLAYYEQRRVELDAYLARAHAYGEEQTRQAEARPSPLERRLRALLEERRQANSSQAEA